MGSLGCVRERERESAKGNKCDTLKEYDIIGQTNKLLGRSFPVTSASVGRSSTSTLCVFKSARCEENPRKGGEKEEEGKIWREREQQTRRNGGFVDAKR